MRSRISKTWPCHLKRAVLLSLLSGLFILPSQINAETSGEEYKDHQIAEADWDGAKAEQDFWSGKGIRNGSDYTFNKNTIISTELSKGSLVFHKTDPGIMDQLYAFGALVWGSSKTGTVNMNGHDLSLRAGKGDLHRIGGSFQWGGRGSAGLFVRSGNLTMKNLGSLSVSGVDYGIYLFAERSDDEAANSNLWIRNGGSADHAVKIRSEGKGIYLQSTPGAARLTVDGDVDIEAPSGIVVDRGEAAVGGGKIDSKGEAAVSVNAKSKFYMNAGVDTEGNVTVAHSERNVQVLGDIRSKQNSSVFIGLGNSQSVLKGLFTTDLHTWPYNEWVLTGSKGFLALKNGATWEHEKYGTGRDKNGRIDVGDSHLTRLNADGGVIIQKDKRKIQIDDFRGNAKLIYDHQNDGTKIEDYTAGDFIIDKAGQNSFLTVVTSNSGLDMGNKEKVSQALNALAGKVYYSSYVTDERNLKGKAVVAEGLTASSAELGFGNITFTQDKGQGTVKSEDVKVTAQPAAELSPITGDAGKDKYYAEKKIRQADGTYLFKENTDLQMTDGQPMVSSEKPVVIKAEGKRLAFTSAGDQNGTVSTVQQSSKDSLSITAKELAVKAGNKSGRSEGIHLQNGNKQNAYKTDITGDVTIQSKGKGYALGAYVAGNSSLDIHGNMTIKEEGGTWGVENTANPGGAYAHYSTAGLYAGSNYAIQKGGRITVDGDVDLKVKGTGILANGGGSTVVVKGGGTVSIENNDDAAHYALAAESGKIDFNVDEDEIEAGTKKVTIEGNVGVLNGAVNPSEPQKYSQIYLGLGTGASLWRGLAVDTHTKQNNADGFEGQLSLFMKNGATWINEAYGMTPEGFKGSKVYYLQGGKSKEEAGVIFQKDENPIRIENYAGNMKLIYAHENAGTKAEDYKAGDTHIANATENSWITMVTDRNNINTDNEDQVYEVLNTLAGKLYYEAYTRDEKDLRGEAAIAEGLTASSQTVKMKDLLFKKENGQGYVEDKPVPPANLDVSEQIVEDGLGSGNMYWMNNGYKDGEDDDHRYVLKSDATIKVDLSNPKTLTYGGNQGANVANIIWGDPDYTADGFIDMNGHKLTLVSEANHLRHYASGILSHGGDLEIKNAAGIDIDIHGDKNAKSGIYVWGQGRNGASLTISNDNQAEHAVKIRNTAAEKDAAILVDGRSVKDGGSAKLVIKGLVDVENDDVSVIQANKGDVSIGGGKIIAKGDKASSLKINNDGKIQINGNLSDRNVLTAGAVKHDVQIEGNVLAQKGRLGLVLNTDGSYIKGLIGTDAGTAGQTYMMLSDGASWYHEGKGARTDGIKESKIKNLEADGGNIYQKNEKPITIENYKGNMKLFYKHENAGTKAEDYKSGDVHIGSAAEGSRITVVTDNSGITMTDEAQIYEVLNALAGKLYYDAYKTGEEKLTGQATIAEGLTSSSKTLEMKDMLFKKENGQGYVQGKPTPPPLVNPVRHQIVEANYFAEEARDFWSKAGVYDGKGHYKFDHDLSLVTHAEDDPVTTVNDNKFGNIYWNGDVVGDIDMTGHRLELKSITERLPKKNPNAITVYSGTLTIKNVNGMYIESDPKGSLYGRGILVAGVRGDERWKSGSGHAKLIIENDDDPAHAVKIRVKDTGEDFGAIEAQKHNGSALVDIKGLVDIDSKMWRAVESHGAKVSIGGGTIRGTDVASLAAYTGGSILVNAKLNDENKVEATSATRPVKITGDVSAESGGHVMLGLNNKDSFLKGLVTTDISGINPDTQKWGKIPGKVSMVLANGAVWEHKQVGVGYYHKKGADFNYKNRGKGESIDSHVTSLRADKGILLQNDPHKLTIDKYEGNMKLVYEHENAGTKAEDYKTGDVHIKEAAKNSSVTMMTDNSGITMTDDKQVYNALNTLAGKLYYDAYIKGEKNLKGQATIAEGLTASSATLKMADMDFREASGQGYVKETNPKPNPNPNPKPKPKPKPPIIYGSKETQMMKGAKTAMTSAVLLWRTNNNDLERRMGDIRLGKEENGIWARYLGGKNELDKKNASFKQTYNIAQVGYDKKKGNWTIGAALDYGTGKDTYANGTGKEKLASLALYGAMQKEDGQYLDIILRGSRVKNDYTVYNEMNHRLEGKYRTNGLSLSMEYGKRMKKENGFYIDPSIELTAGHLGGKDYDAVSDYAGGKKMHIHQDGINSVIGRIGLGIGKETERSNLFAKIALAHEFGGKVKSIFSAENEPTSGTEVDLKDSWVDVEVGGSWLVNRNTYLYGTYTRNFGADVSSKWRIDAGIRFSF